MKLNRRTLLSMSVTGLASYPGLDALAQHVWPASPIRLISPYAAGGASDISARILGEKLGRSLGQQFVIENKAGAATRIANEFVARAAPDGYTILYAAAPYVTVEALYGKLSYNPRKDLIPVAKVCDSPIFLIINAQAPFKTLQELIAYGKARPEGLTFGSPGPGSQPHLAAEQLFKDAGVKGLNVHFRGDAPAYIELLAGRVDATFTAISAALPHIQTGKLRVLGVGSAKRISIYPQAEPLREQGLPNVVAAGWYGIMVPSATPSVIVDRLQTEVISALADSEIQRKMNLQGLEIDIMPSAMFGKFIDDETKKWSDVIRKIGIKVE